MRILVIGGTRFVGVLLVRRLLQEGHEVTVLTRGNQRPDFWAAVRHLQADRADHDGMRSKLARERFDAVVDNIAFCRRDVETVLESLAERAGRYLLVTTVRVYSDREHLHLLAEDEAELEHVPPGYVPGADPSQDYAVGKRQAELALWQAAAICPFTILRPASIEGPHDPTGRCWFWLQRIADGGPVLLPRHGFTPMFRHVYAADVAAAIMLCLEKRCSLGRAYNVAGEEIVTLFDYVQLIGSILDREVRTVEASYEVIRQCPGLDRFQAEFVDRRVQDTSRIKTELGFKATPMPAWLAETVRWYGGRPRPDSLGYAQRPMEIATARSLLGRS